MSSDRRPPPAAAAESDALDVFIARAESGLSMDLEAIFDLQTGAVYGYGARTGGLAEMEAEDGAALRERAAALGALGALERIRVQRAFTRLAERKPLMRPYLFVSFDIRALLREPDLPERLECAFDAAARPGRLVLELTLRPGAEDEAAIADALPALRARGAGLALSDFGSAGSTLDALIAHEFDVVKLGERLIDGVASDDRKRLLAGQMAGLARHLGVKTACVGVRRREDFEVCRAIGIDLAQGPYLTARAAQEQADIFSPPTIRRRVAPGVKAALEHIEPAHRDTPLIDIASRFRNPEHAPLCPIVGDCGEPLGAVRERDLRPYAFSSFGLDLIRNPTGPIRLEQILRRYPQADIESDPDRLIALLSQSDADGLLITNGVRYAGFIPAERLVRLGAAKRLAEAQDANPLTGLPGNRMVAAFMEQALAETSRRRLFCYLDFDHFKPFNDVYGFRTGDRAITMFAEILKQSFGDSHVCHIGGDDFFIGKMDRDEASFFGTLEAVLQRFEAEVESLYSPEDRAMGGVIAKGRDGAPRRFPLLRCSAGVVSAPAGHALCSVERMAQSIARIKRMAKDSPSGMAQIHLPDPEWPICPGPYATCPVPKPLKMA